jgi:hypothetical protein
MNEKEKTAILTFMLNVLNTLYPDHDIYPFEDLRIIDKTEGSKSKKWNKYSDNTQRAYWIKKSIEIISDGKIKFKSINVNSSNICII